jgi:HAMP domain-containing protein
MLFGVALAWLIGRGIANPVVQMAGAMHLLSAGKLEQAIPAVDRGDEVGQMAQAMLVFRQNAIEARKLQGEAERVRVAKDRRQGAMDQHTQDFGTLASGVMATLVDAAGSMRKTASEMTDAARRTREIAARTAENANKSARNLGAVTAAAEEMSASIHEISEQVARATKAAHEAVELASATDRKVGGMAAAVERVGTQEACKDMDQASGVSEAAQASSQSVERNADQVGGVADGLGSELTQFLEAMTKTDDANRRRYERIPGNGAEAVFRPPGAAEVRALIADISRGGVGLRTNWAAAAGAEAQVSLPGVDTPVTARVARTLSGVLVLAFRQDEAMLRQVDVALARIGGAAMGRLAA